MLLVSSCGLQFNTLPDELNLGQSYTMRLVLAILITCVIPSASTAKILLIALSEIDDSGDSEIGKGRAPSVKLAPTLCSRLEKT